MQSIAVCAVKQSCESILESYVSRYENHFDYRRNNSEVSANEEFEIAVNGPNLANCDSVVKDAMKKYWAKKGGQWHFFKQGVLKQDSPVLKRMKNSKNKFYFMN